jgi:ABC-2 type transport system permease protein
MGAIAFITRDLRKFFRNPGLITISLFLPLLQLMVIGNAFGGKVRDVPVSLVDLDHGPEALRLREKFKALEANASTFRIRMEDTIDRTVAAARDGKVSAGIIIPENYSRRVNQKARPQVGLVLDNTDPFVTTTLTQKMSEVLADVNSPAVKPRQPERVSLEVVEIFPYIEYIQYLLPGSITLAIAVASLMGGGLLYIDDKARGFHEGYLVTPVSKLQLVLGLVGSGTIKATIVGTVVTFAGSWLAGASELLTFRTAMLLVLLCVLVAFTLISMISVLIVRVSDPAIPRATFGILNTLLFFPSGAMYPIHGFPEWLKAISVVDPFTYAVHAFRSLLLKNVGPEAVMNDVMFLAAFGAICICGVVLLFPRHL